MTKSIIGLTVTGLTLALTSFATATPQPGVQPRSPAEDAAFTFAFDGHFGPSSHELFSDNVAFRLGGNDDVTVTGEKSTPHTLTVKRGSDGQLAIPKETSQLGDLIYDYNTLVKVAAQMPKSPAAGASWKTQIPVRVSPDTWADVPIDVRVVNAAIGGATLEANGTKEATLFYKGFTFPIDVTVHATETFGADGRLGSATFKADELTQGGLGPKISYNWKFGTR
jgi:hypothetical protein